MTAQSKSVIKTYFETGDKPDESQFADLIDSYQDANSNLTALASAGTGAVGLQVLAAATTAAAQNALGGGTVGKQIFACVTTAAAQNIVGGGAAGDMLKSTYDPANIGQQVVGTSAAQTLESKIVITAAASSASTGFRLPHGAAPFTPVDGDMWTTTSGLFGRVNGSTTQFLTAATPPPATPVALSGTNSVITVDFTTYSEYELIIDLSAISGIITIEASSNGGGAYATTTYKGNRISNTTATSQTTSIYNTPGGNDASIRVVMSQPSTSASVIANSVAVGSDGTNGANQTALSLMAVSAAANRIRISVGTSWTGYYKIKPIGTR